MLYRVEVAELARDEIRKALGRYEDGAKAARSLRNGIERVLKKLEHLPFMYPEFKGDFRKAGLPEEFGLYYVVEEDLVEVYAIIHDRRGPEYRFNRLSGRSSSN